MINKVKQYTVVEAGFGKLSFWLVEPSGRTIATFKTKKEADLSCKTANLPQESYENKDLGTK